MEWFTENAVSIMAVIAAVYGLALVIVKLTPNKQDDKVLAEIGKVLELLNLKAEQEDKADADS